MARTCRRFYFLAWEPELWARIVFTEETKDTDRALKTTLALAARNGVCVSAAVRRVSLSGCGRLTDRGLALVARRCQLLEQLEVRNLISSLDISRYLTIYLRVCRCSGARASLTAGCWT